MRKGMARLWDGEWLATAAHWDRLVAAVAVITAVSVPVGLSGTLHLLDYLGPALGDDTGFHAVLGVIHDLQSQGAAWLWLPVAIAAVMAFRGCCIYRAWRDYPATDAHGAAFPATVFMTFIGFNALLLAGMAVLALLAGVVASLLGFSFADGSGLLASVVKAAYALADRVPTVLALPALPALLVIFASTGFFHYWLHRLAHEFRLPWLLLHRPHHMPTALIEPVVTGVIVAFPLGFLVMFPYALFFGLCSKLVSAEPLFLEVIVLNLLAQLAAVSAHSTALYDLGFRQRWLGFLGHLIGSAHYHYLHHASHPVYAHHNSNLTNLGGGWFLMWDRLFGTYCEPLRERPPIGLTGQPPLHMNPLRLLLAGIAQLAYEWRHNRSWAVRWKILTGPSDYAPPVSCDFAIKPA